MATINMKVIPNTIPVSSGDRMHYCDISFLIYRTETEVKETVVEARDGGIMAIKKGPRIVITAKAAREGSLLSEDALCMASDIPSAGYSFQKPDGWDCTYSYDSRAGEVTFTVNVPVNGGGGFTAAQIRIKSYYTTAQAGVCTLNVKAQNMKQFASDMTDRSFSVPLCKKYELEILKFTANNLTGEFFLNHKLPVEFSWNVVCDNDTPLELMKDDILFTAVQEFTGEYRLLKRKKGLHTYTLKMTLSGGEKTKSIRIGDTRWRNINAPAGLTPDFTQQNRMLAWKNGLYIFYDNKLYKSKLGGNYVWSDWNEILTYEGGVLYPAVTAQIIRDGKLYLIGGTKEGSDDTFYSVCDLTKKSGWTDYRTGLNASFAGGVAACGGEEESWFIYAKRVDDFLFLEQYDENDKMFDGFYQIYMEGMKDFDICIRDNVLYIAIRNEEEISLMTLSREETKHKDAGFIDEAVQWIKWVSGKNNMYLLSDVGLYREGAWENVEDFNPPYEQGKYPWLGVDKKRIAGMIPTKGDSTVQQAWATDAL